MQPKNAIRIYLETLGAVGSRELFPHLMGFTLKTTIGACHIKVNLKDATMFVDFFQNSKDAKDIFEDQRVDMVGSHDHFFQDIKEHFDFIFASIEGNNVEK